MNSQIGNFAKLRITID